MPFCSFSEGAAMFDVTPIENMFLLEYLPTAPDGYLRVYLYARMLCLHPELGGEMADVAKALHMEEEAFEGVTAKVVVLPVGVIRIGSRAFADCENLLYLIAPVGTELIVADNAFEGSDVIII